MNIAVEGNEVAMELHAPGSDIVGFEHAAESDDDKAAVDAAIRTLSDPLSLFVVPEAAGCKVSRAEAALESDAAHDEDHAEEHGGGHSEFHADYALSCSAPEALTQITFAFFDAFPNAREVQVQLVTETVARSVDVERGDPVLDLGG